MQGSPGLIGNRVGPNPLTIGCTDPYSVQAVTAMLALPLFLVAARWVGLAWHRRRCRAQAHVG